MKERLEKFIRTEGLTPSRFAEIMGVQPSSISHILSGRNKPSFDFIEKMLLRFPKVNPDWLLLGKGPIYRISESIPSPIPNTSSSSNTVQPSPTSPQAYTLPFENPTAQESLLAEPPLNSSQLSHSPAVSKEDPKPIAHSTATSSPESPSKSFGQTVSELSIFSQLSEEMIDQIVVFLKDKTFIAYRPH